jgi:hypothetical protein
MSGDACRRLILNDPPGRGKQMLGGIGSRLCAATRTCLAPCSPIVLALPCGHASPTAWGPRRPARLLHPHAARLLDRGDLLPHHVRAAPAHGQQPGACRSHAGRRAGAAPVPGMPPGAGQRGAGRGRGRSGIRTQRIAAGMAGDADWRGRGPACGAHCAKLSAGTRVLGYPNKGDVARWREASTSLSREPRRPADAWGPGAAWP